MFLFVLTSIAFMMKERMMALRMKHEVFVLNCYSCLAIIPWYEEIHSCIKIRLEVDFVGFNRNVTITDPKEMKPMYRRVKLRFYRPKTTKEYTYIRFEKRCVDSLYILYFYLWLTNHTQCSPLANALSIFTILYLRNTTYCF